jgi:predicted P-loop ATPase
VPYGKAMEDFPRRSIIVGSTNRDTGFLIDDTGNRRFWVIPVDVQGMIEVDGLLLERDAIWSAAVAAYKAGEPNHLPRDLERQVADANLAYLVESPWLAPVREWLASPRNAGIPVTTEVLLTDAIGKPIERQSRADQMQLASILRELGLVKRRRLIDGTQKWVYCLPPG